MKILVKRYIFFTIRKVLNVLLQGRFIMYKKLLLAVLVALSAHVNTQTEYYWSGLGDGLGMGFACGAFFSTLALASSLRQLHNDDNKFNKSTMIGTGVSIAALAYFGAFTAYAFKNSVSRNQEWSKLIAESKNK